MTEFDGKANILSIPPAAGNRQRWGGLSGSGVALVIGEAAGAERGVSLAITADSASALRLEQELRFYSDDSALTVLHFPDWETLPYDAFSPHHDIISERLHTLYQLGHAQRAVLVVPVTTLMQRLPPVSYVSGNSLVLDCGQRCDIDALSRQLDAAGYRHVETVFEHGEFAVRGAIIDIFPMGSELPYRIDLFDDEIDTLRTFDPDNQRTLEKVEAIRLLPAKEVPLDKPGIAKFRERWHDSFDVDHRRCPVYRDVSAGISPAGIEYYLPLFFDETASLLDYLPPHTTIFCVGELPGAAEHFWGDVQQRYGDCAIDPLRPVLPPAQLFFAVDQLFSALKNHSRIDCQSAPLQDAAGCHNFPCAEPPK